MLQLDEYVSYIEKDIFPNGLLALQQCKNAEELTMWKKLLCKQICGKQVEGEDVPSENSEWAQTTDPQELKLMNMAQRVFIESRKFIAEQNQMDAVFKKE